MGFWSLFDLVFFWVQVSPFGPSSSSGGFGLTLWFWGLRASGSGSRAGAYRGHRG